MIEVILDGSRSIDTIHDVLSSALKFPQWYGRNLDALHDCLTDVTFDVCICLVRPADARLAQVLRDCAQENPYIHVVIQDT